MDSPELIPDSGFSADDSVRDAASGVKAWDAPAGASDEPAALPAVSREDALWGVPGGLVVLRAGVVVAAAR